MIKNILVLTPSCPSNSEDDRIVPPLFIYLRGLRSRYPKLSITLISIHYPFTKMEYKIDGINFISLGAANGSLLRRPPIWQAILRKAKSLHKKSSFDLVHSFWMNEPALLGNKISKKLNIPHLCTLMGQDVLPNNRYLKLFYASKMNLVFLSKFHRSSFEKVKQNENFNIVPWGIQEGEIGTSNANRKIDLICVSSLIPLKRVHLFIKAVEKLGQNFPETKAVIVGEGKLEIELKQLVSELGLDQNITFFGGIPRSEALSLMQNSKILVHCSEFESQGYVINEALAKGCKVVATSLGVDINPNLTICEDHDLVAKTTELLNTFTEKVIVPITMEQTITQYWNIYQRLISKNS